MKPVDQSICNFINGDCFRACVASIFEVPLDAIPNFTADGPENFAALLDKWSTKNNLFCFDVSADSLDPDWIKDMYVIATGPSPRDSSKLHAVVWKNGKLAHDPHPSKLGLADEPTIFTFFALKDYPKYKIRETL